MTEYGFKTNMIMTAKFLKSKPFFNCKDKSGVMWLNYTQGFAFLYNEHKVLERNPSTNVEKKLNVASIAQIQVWN